MSQPGHGPNLGHGFVKYVLIDADGRECEPVVFPAQIARAARNVNGALVNARTVEAGGQRWWTGDDAALAPSPLTILAQARLSDATFIPALLAGALDRLGRAGKATGDCVTGLPATWADDRDRAALLGERLRAVRDYTSIRVIAEPLGLIYSQLLDNDGRIVGDEALRGGRVAVVDLGHLTVDVAVLHQLRPVPTSLDTWQLGTAQPLRAIRSRLSAVFERELTLTEADTAARARALTVAGRRRELPRGWDAPLAENGAAIAARLVETWGAGAQLDAVLLGGGGAELAPLVDAIRRRLPHAIVVERPQTAIARGYARLARRIGSGRR